MPWIVSSRCFAVWALLLVTSLLIVACASGGQTDAIEEDFVTTKDHATIGGTTREASGLVPERTVGEKTSLGKTCDPDAPIDDIRVDTPLAFADEKRLVAVSDNVFVGRVLRKLREVPPSQNPMPSTAFAVEVEGNIKGSLSGTATVSQGGGCDPKYGRVVLINGDSLLKPGEEAVFATSKDSSGDSYSLVSYKRSHATFETEEQEARLVARFREAKGDDR